MSDKTVKIEYQFIGEDVGLTTKIDDIYKKLDKLGEGASVTIKKLDGLNKETITLTNNLGNSSAKMNVFSSEMKEMQREIALATAEVNRLNEALMKQQALMNSTGNKGSLTAQKELARLTNESAKAMQNLATVQKKLKTSALDFKGTPKFALMEKDLNNINTQLKQTNTLSNELSKNLSKKTYRVNGNSISGVKNANANTKAIEEETKAITQNTRAKIQNAKVQASPFSKEASRITADMKKITQAYKEGKSLTTATDFKGTDLEVSGKTIASMYRNNNSNVKKLLNSYSQEVAKRDALAKKLNSVSAMDKTSKMTEAYIKQAVKAQKALKDVDDAINKVNTNKNFENTNRNYRKTISNIQSETKAIEANTQANSKNYQVLGDLSKLKGKSLTVENTASKAQEQAKSIGAIATQINTKAKALESAIKNNDTAIIGTLQNEIRGLLAQRQALEKLQGKTLTNTANTKYQTTNVKNTASTPNVVSNIDAQLKSQQSLNSAKMEQLRIEQQIAQQNAKTANKNAKNIKEQLRLEGAKTEEAKKRVDYYNEANKQRQQYNQQQAYNKKVSKLPNDLQNLTDAYKKATARIKADDANLKQVNKTISDMLSKGALKKDDISKVSKLIDTQNKKILDDMASINKVNQKTVDALTIGRQKLYELKNLNLKSLPAGSKTYRLTDAQKATTPTVSGITGYKTLASDMRNLNKEMKTTEGSLKSLLQNFNNVSQNALKLKNSIGSLGNITQLTGKGIIGLGRGIQGFGKNLMGVGQNIQMVTNSLRMLSMVASGVFAYAGQQGIEFNRSLMGVASTLNRISIDKDTGKAVIMSDLEFDSKLEQLSQQAREQARTSIYDANQVMEGYRFTALAGWDADEMMASMPSFIDMATVARIEGENFADVVDLITDSLASLGMAYEGIDTDGDGVFDEKVKKDSANLAKEVEHLNDVMIKAQAISNMDVTQLAEGFKIAGSQLSGFGLEVEEISSLFAILANRGIKGSKAATGLSSIMANLTGKTGQAKKALDEITEKTGIDVSAYDKGGKYIGIDKHLDKLSTAFKKLKEMYGTEYGVDNLQLSQMLGGKHHFKTLVKMLEGYQTGEYSEVLAILQNSDGATAEGARIAEQSTWAKTKMAISEVKEAMLSLWDAIEPIYLKILDVISVVAREFTKLSDEQKVSIAKWGAFIVVGTSVLSILGMLAIIIGSLVSLFGGLIVGAGKAILVLGGIVSAMAGWTGISTFIATVAPALVPMIEYLSQIGILIKNIGGMTLARVAFSVIGLFKCFVMVKDAIMDAYNASSNFGEFMLRTFLNFGDQFEHFIMGLANKIIDAFQSLSPIIKKALWTMFNGALMGIPGLIKGTFDKVGITDFLSGKFKGFRFESNLDKKAKEEGYENYEDKKNNRKRENLTNIITTIFDGEETGAFSALIKKVEEAKNGKITLTTEDLQSDAISYRLLQTNIKANKEKIINLQANIEMDENKVAKFNKQIEEVRNKLAQPNISAKDKTALEAQLIDLTKKRDAQFELKLKNEEEVKAIQEELTKTETKLITVETQYKEAGLGEELDYESRKAMFEKEYGMKLVFADFDKDSFDLEKLQASLPVLETELKAKVDLYRDDPNKQKEFSEAYMMLEKVQQMKLTIPITLELMNEQKVITDAEDNLKKLEEQKITIQAEIDKLTVAKGLKPEELTGDAKQTYGNYKKEKDKIDEDIKTNKTNISNAQAKAKTINNGDFTNVYAMWQEMYSNYDKPMIKLFDENEVALMNRILNDRDREAQNNANKTNEKEIKSKGKVDLKTNKFESKEEKIEKSKKTGESPLRKPISNKQKFNLTEKETTDMGLAMHVLNGGEVKVKGGTSATKENTTAKNENTKASEKNTKANQDNAKSYEELADKATIDIDTTPIDGLGEKSQAVLDKVGGNTGEIVQQVQDVASAISEMSFDSITEAMAIMLVVVGEVREKLSGIAGFAVNTGLSSFNTMGDALKTKITEARELLTNMFGYINNTGLNSFNNMTSGLQGKLDEIKISLSTLGEGIDTTGLSGIGEVLSTSISGARTALLNICGVANNSGVSSMTNMGNALTKAINGARTALLNVCGVARNSGVSAMSAMGGALTSAINSAKSSVAGIASQINSIKLNASSIKIPSPTPVPATAVPASLASMQGINSAVRSINNTTSSSNTVNTSNFNFNMKGIMSNNRKDIKDTAKQLTIYCKRKGL